MGVILCENNAVRNPYYINSLGIHVYSIEEICYVIMNHPLVALDDLVNDRLVAFIRDQARPGMAGLQFARRYEDGMNDSEVLIAILSLSGYYSIAEIDRFKGKLTEIKLTPKYKILKDKGNQIFNMGKFGQAISTYKSAVTEAAYQKAPLTFFASAYKNIGAAYANLFDYDNAFASFKTSYEYIKNEDLLKYIYFIAQEQPIIEKKEKYLSYIGDRVDPEWDEIFRKAKIKSNSSDEVNDFSANLATDSVKKNKYLAYTINAWKQDYRKKL